jgi:hypothetical protein
MPATAPDAVDQPQHPLHALATFELRRYRQQLENALAVFGANDRLPTAGGDLQARLDAVLAEQEERARLAVHA